MHWVTKHKKTIADMETQDKRYSVSSYIFYVSKPLVKMTKILHKAEHVSHCEFDDEKQSMYLQGRSSECGPVHRG